MTSDPNPADIPAGSPRGLGRSRPTNVRWMIFALACCTSFLLYLHRYAWGIVMPYVAEEFEWDTITLGTLTSCFTASYSASQIPSGILGDWFGPRAVLATIIMLWSVALGGIALAGGVKSMGGARFLFGVAQAGCYPNLNKVSKLWFPMDVRTTVQGWVASFFGRFGGAAAFVIVGTVMLGWCHLTWRGAIWILTGAGLAFGLLFLILFRNRPADHPWANAEEANLVVLGDPDSATAERSALNWRLAVGNRNMAALMVQQFTSAYADSLYANWIPLFLIVAMRVEVTSAGWMAAMPLIGGALGGMIGGTLQSALLVRRYSRRWVRSGVGCTGKLLAAVLMFASLGFESARLIMALFFCVKFFGDWSQPTVWGTTTDIGGRNSASVFSLVNSVGAFAAFISGPTFGLLILYFSQDIAVEGEVIRAMAPANASSAMPQSDHRTLTRFETTSNRALVPGTLRGTLFDSGEPVADFHVGEGGGFEFEMIGSPSAVPQRQGSRLNHQKGEMQIAWSAPPGDVHAVVSYKHTLYGTGWTALFLGLSGVYLLSSISWLFVDCTRTLDGRRLS